MIISIIINMQLLILSGILIMFLPIIDCNILSHVLEDIQCAFKHTLCNPDMIKPCCNPKDECKQTWPDNLFRCVGDIILWGLGKYCELDEDCSEINHAKCSKNHDCVCRMKTVRINAWKCAPLLNEFCWKNESCATDNAVCINNECQCTENYYSRFNNQCIRNVLGVSCEDDKICEQVKFASCSKDKICTCAFNTTAVDSSYCAPIIGGVCFHTYDCLPKNSICSNNRCKCMGRNIYDPKSGCIPASKTVCSNSSICTTALSNSICSQANRCECFKNNLEEFFPCTSMDNIHCLINYQCIINNSICINNFCQCQPGFEYKYHRCVAYKYLEDACIDHNECSHISHAICSRENSVCVCDENYIESNNTFCKPLLDGFCSKNEDCFTINSECIKNKCQCKENLVQFSKNLCTIPQLGILCHKDFDCEKILNSQCSQNKECNCILNYEQYNITACAPLLGSNCSNLCVPLHSSCINNKCICDYGFQQSSIDQCVPNYIGMKCKKNIDCLTILNSKCTNENICACENNYAVINATACAPILGEHCKLGEQCAISNSLCINKTCQCQHAYIKTTENRCVTITEYFYKSCETRDDCNDIKYSYCSFNKKCTCRSNYIFLGDRKCIGLIGEYCDSDDECISYDTVCINNKCQCSKKFYASSKRQCDPISLGVTCYTNFDCSVTIKNSECSVNERCVCLKNYYALNDFECVPFFFETCSSNDDCKFNSSVCIENKCVCKQNFRSVSENQCQPFDYMYMCNQTLDCGDPWHYKCDPDKRCHCNSNHYLINRSTCMPLLKGYCWKDSQCLTNNSICIDYHCECKDNFVSVSNNLCRPVANLTRIFF